MTRGMILAGFMLFGMLVSYADSIAVEGEILMAGFTLIGVLVTTMITNTDKGASRFTVSVASSEGMASNLTELTNPSM